MQLAHMHRILCRCAGSYKVYAIVYSAFGAPGLSQCIRRMDGMSRPHCLMQVGGRLWGAGARPAGLDGDGGVRRAGALLQAGRQGGGERNHPSCRSAAAACWNTRE